MSFQLEPSSEDKGKE